jgi:hypothetical protein
MEQMMERLMAGMEARMMAEMNATQHKTKAHHEEMMAKIDAWRGVTPARLGKEENKPLKKKYVEDENEGIKKKRKVKSEDAILPTACTLQYVTILLS